MYLEEGEEAWCSEFPKSKLAAIRRMYSQHINTMLGIVYDGRPVGQVVQAQTRLT